MSAKQDPSITACRSDSTSNPSPAPSYWIWLDLSEPFPTYNLGNRWIVVTIYHATHHAVTGALLSATATEAAQFLLNSVILIHGSPQELVTERGCIFLSRVVSARLRLCSIVHRPTTAYHPQSNGITQRFNPTIGNMLSMYVSANHTDWNAVLPIICLPAHNAISTFLLSLRLRASQFN